VWRYYPTEYPTSRLHWRDPTGLQRTIAAFNQYHASWDGVIAGLWGLRVIHEVARLYGLRPGPAVTLCLVRKVVWIAAGVAGLALLSQGLADQAVGSLPFIKHITASVPGAGLAAMRSYRLSRIAAEASCPVHA
jgi:hypothetical protein